MELIDLKLKTREKTGNGPARVLRRNGEVPAVLYGPKTESILLSVPEKELEDILRKGRINKLLFNLSVLDKDIPAKNVMVKEIQRHPVTQRVLHVDFYEVAMDRKIRVNVPVRTIGKSIGVDNGGILQIIRREIEVLCYPNNVPEAITIDIATLDVGESYHVRDIPLSGSVEIPSDVNFTILTIVNAKSDKDKEEASENASEEEAAEKSK